MDKIDKLVLLLIRIKTMNRIQIMQAAKLYDRAKLKKYIFGKCYFCVYSSIAYLQERMLVNCNTKHSGTSVYRISDVGKVIANVIEKEDNFDLDKLNTIVKKIISLDGRGLVLVSM